MNFFLKTKQIRQKNDSIPISYQTIVGEGRVYD